jgi:hypothetical protein
MYHFLSEHSTSVHKKETKIHLFTNCNLQSPCNDVQQLSTDTALLNLRLHTVDKLRSNMGTPSAALCVTFSYPSNSQSELAVQARD